MKKIHVGFLLSYDYELLKSSIPPCYAAADRIFLARDRHLRTWNGRQFDIEPGFYDWLKELDVDHKIELYEDDFYVAALSTMENDTRERTMLAQRMGIGNWLIQVDSDEYFLDFAKFVADLRRYDHFLDDPEKHKIQIFAFWLIIYKHTEHGILIVDEPMKSAFATNFPNYKAARRTNERVIYVDSLVLHDSVARSESELRFKLENWSHNVNVNAGFLSKWLAVNEANWQTMSDFYYIEPERWKRLKFVPTKSLGEMGRMMATSPAFRITPSFLRRKNLGQRIKFLFKRG